MEERLKKILSFILPGEELISWQYLSGGHIHQTIRVQIADEDLVFQQLNPSVFPDLDSVMANYKEIKAHLRVQEFAYQLPEFLQWPDGTLIYYGKDRAPWRVMHFLKGYQVKDQAESLNDVESAAKVMGSLTKYLNHMDTSRVKEVIPDFFNGTRWLDKFKNALEEGSPERRETSSWLGKELLFRSAYHEMPKVRQRVIHGDGKISNFMFNQNGDITAILDWDTAMPGTVLDEFGYLARSFINRKAEDDVQLYTPYLNKEYLDVLQEQFIKSSGGCLSDKEEELLIFGVKRTVWIQAIRFLADYLQGDQYYPVTRPDQNLDRANNQFGLLSELEVL